MIAQKEEAMEWTTEHTREDKDHRLRTAQSKETLYAEYVGATSNPLSKHRFVEVYRQMRVIREKHCGTDVYSCPICTHSGPQAEAKLANASPNSAEYLALEEEVKAYHNHKEAAKTQSMDSLSKLTDSKQFLQTLE